MTAPALGGEKKEDRQRSDERERQAGDADLVIDESGKPDFCHCGVCCAKGVADRQPQVNIPEKAPRLSTALRKRSIRGILNVDHSQL
jgi:hypothetical protein